MYTETHANLRIELFKLKLSMQEVFEEFAQRVANGDAGAHQILQEIYDQKRAGNIRKISKTDADSIYDMINSEDS